MESACPLEEEIEVGVIIQISSTMSAMPIIRMMRMMMTTQCSKKHKENRVNMTENNCTGTPWNSYMHFKRLPDGQ